MSEIDSIRLKIKQVYTDLATLDPSVENYNPIKEIISTMNNGYIGLGKQEYVRDENVYFSLSSKDKINRPQGSNPFSNFKAPTPMPGGSIFDVKPTPSGLFGTNPNNNQSMPFNPLLTKNPSELTKSNLLTRQVSKEKDSQGPLFTVSSQEISKKGSFLPTMPKIDKNLVPNKLSLEEQLELDAAIAASLEDVESKFDTNSNVSNYEYEY